MDEVVNIIISLIIAASAVALGIARSRRKMVAPTNTEPTKMSRSQEMQQKVMEWHKNNSHDNIAGHPQPTESSDKSTDNTATTKTQPHNTKKRKQAISGNDDSIVAGFNLRDAVLYSEIMKPKFDE